jgi:hypothetical protein
LFRRTKSDPAPDSATDSAGDPAQRKGRPTPSRKEAEAAARARAKVPRSRKEIAAAQKLSRTENSGKMRAAMRSGDDRYLPARDKGLVKRFIRDHVDSHFSFIELMIPVMLIVLIMGYVGNSTITSYANLTMLALFVLIIVDMLRLRARLKKEISTRFPDAAMKGATYYAVSRALQMRFMRLPKAQVKVGEKLPERYR